MSCEHEPLLQEETSQISTPLSSPHITNNDIRSGASTELLSSREDHSSSGEKNRESTDLRKDKAPTKESSLTASSSVTDRTLDSEISKASKTSSSSPDCNLKSSGASSGSQRVAFAASVYQEIAPIGGSGATANPPPDDSLSDLNEREAECLTTLMRLLSAKSHSTTSQTAVKFLMARKFDLVRAWGLYESHLQRRRKYRLDALNPREEPLQGELQRCKFAFLGTRDKLGRAIALFEAKNHLQKQSKSLTVIQALSLHLDHALSDSTTQRQGLVLIYNMTDSGVRNLDYELAKETLDFLQEGYPARLHKTYVLNAPLWFRAAVRLFKPFLKKKVIERLQMVNSDELLAMLPPQSIPVSLGGKLQFSHQHQIELIISHWVVHPFTLTPPVPPERPDRPNKTLKQYHSKSLESVNKITESPSTDSNSIRYSPPESKPPLPPKRNSSGYLPPSAFSRLTSVTDRQFSVPQTPSSVDPLDTFQYQRQVPVLDEGDYPMNLEHLKGYVEGMGRKGLEEEYMKLRGLNPEGSFTNSIIPYNVGKNRYRDVPTFDHSRVKLEKLNTEGDPDPHDYINANHIDSYNAPNTFIMCQGPIPNTVSDFWRMVWEKKVLTIVMVTRCTEGSRLKCVQYWPEIAEGKTRFDGVIVTPVDETPSRGFVIRRFSIKSVDSEESESREVTHFQYIAWPDYGVPDNGDEVLHLMECVLEEQAKLVARHFSDSQFLSPLGPPIVAHCSAGIGRSGTFCSIHSLIRQYRATGMVSVQGTVRKLRRQRAFAIQAPEQFTFIYQSILEYMQKHPTGLDSIPLSTSSMDSDPKV